MNSDQDDKEAEFEEINGEKPKRKRLTKAQQQIRNIKAVKLLIQGLSYQEIADALMFASASGAWKAIDKTLTELPFPEAEQHRRIQHERNQAIVSRLLPEVLVDPLDDVDFDQDGSAKRARILLENRNATVDRIMKVHDRDAKLLGLDAPTKQEITGNNGAPFEVVMTWPMPDPNTEVIPQEELGNQT